MRFLSARPGTSASCLKAAVKKARARSALRSLALRPPSPVACTALLSVACGSARAALPPVTIRTHESAPCLLINRASKVAGKTHSHNEGIWSLGERHCRNRYIGQALLICLPVAARGGSAIRPREASEAVKTSVGCATLGLPGASAMTSEGEGQLNAMQQKEGQNDLKLEQKNDLKHESEMASRGAGSKLKHEGDGAGSQLKHEGDRGTTAGLKVELEQEKEDSGAGQPGVLVLLAKTSEEEERAKIRLEKEELTLPARMQVVQASQEDGAREHLAGIDFDPAAYMSLLQTAVFGRVLLASARVPSTHTILSKNFGLLPLGTVCVSDVQYEGKGRAGNTWQSPKGCLMASFTTQEANGRLLPFLQYVVCLAACQGIEEATQRRKKSPQFLEVRIKWPNDLYSHGQKIGGILCTSTYSDKMFNVTIGFGLNVANREPTTCLNALLEETAPGVEPFTREEILACIMQRFEVLHTAFQTSGFETLKGAYLERWLHNGQKVTLGDNDSGESSSQQALTIKGGYLLAEDEAGEDYELHPDGNSLDFFKGLVRKKLDTYI